MKKILITGQNSYIGNSFERYIKENYSGVYHIDKISLKNDEWKSIDFNGYDSIFHVAGIAHSDNGKISVKKEKLYRTVNTDLTINTAKKAKTDGVKQFIFMSSATVYGDSGKIGQKKIITKDTLVNPANCYGDSKVQAEIGIEVLRDSSFKVVILRSPMIYGPGCKGNFLTLEKLVDKMPIFPKVDNARSMLYIGHLVEFVRLMIENEEDGIFWPCNKEWSNTSEVVKMIGEAKEKKIKLISGFVWVLKLMSHFTGLVNKAFGNLAYEDGLGEYDQDYREYNLSESIKESVTK